jgi:hypothetical protein
MTARHALVLGLALCAMALLLILAAPADGLRAWLAAAFLWSGLPFGSLGFLMVIRLVGGRWDQALPVYFEAGALTLPIAFAALLPPLFGMRVLYPWVDAALSGFKGWWLTPLPFVLRTLLLFLGAGLALWALVTRRGSALAIASAGLLFLVPILTLVLVDWLVSLDAQFHSSGFGLYALSIQFTVALMAAVWLLLGRQPEQTAALAAIMITLILVWLYLAFTHYIIIWSGDLADVVGWYKDRGRGGWGLAYTLAAVIEAVAFLILIFPKPRRSASVLRAIAAAMLFGKLVEAAWLVLPQGGAMRPGAIVLYLLAAGGLGLVFLSAQPLLLERRTAARAPA